MKKLIFELFGLAFCLFMLVSLGSQKATEDLIFPFALMLMASGVAISMVVSTITKLFSK
jgi:ABC-type polysaccharide/polyol phosphate export permease